MIDDHFLRVFGYGKMVKRNGGKSMSKVIRISESIFRRLQQLAVSLVDTPGSVIERLLDFYDSQQNRGVSIVEGSGVPGQAKPLDSVRAPEFVNDPSTRDFKAKRGYRQG